jgi:hypothetical protein
LDLTSLVTPVVQLDICKCGIAFPLLESVPVMRYDQIWGLYWRNGITRQDKNKTNTNTNTNTDTNTNTNTNTNARDDTIT